MIEKPSILVGIGKPVKRLINHPWFIAIVGGIIVTGLFYCVSEKPHILSEINRIVRSYITIPWIITITACVIVVVGIVLYFRHRRKTQIEEGRVEKEEISKEDLRTGVTILSPLSGLCLGRDSELSQLETDLEHRNILLIKGIAGIGKTTLGLKFKDNLEKKGYKTFWSQISYNSYEGFLFELSEYLKGCGSVYAGHIMREATPEKRFKIAVQELCEYPTVVFLDDFQKLEDDSDFKVFKDYLRNSTLVIMSREQPTFLLEDYENLPYLDRQSSLTLLKKLGLKEPEAVLRKIYEKTKGHPWSLERFVKFSYNLPARKLFEEIPDFGREQQAYISEQCWNTLSKGERDFLMRASVFTKPLNFDALEVCSENVSKIIMSLAQIFFIRKRGKYYYIHDIIRDYAFSELKKDERLYGEAQRRAAGYYRKNVSAENLLLVHYHLKGAGEYREGIDLIVDDIKYFWREGFWSDVRKVLEESLGFFNDDEMIARICNSLGTIVFMLGEWNEALKYHEKDLEISEKLGDMSGQARAYGNIGLVYRHKGDWDEALKYHEKDLEISEKLGDMSGQARAYGNIGFAYYVKGDWDEALKYHEKSLEISEKLGDMFVIARAYNNIGVVYHDKGEWDKALKYHEKHLEISEKLGDMSGIATAYGNIGVVYYFKGDWDKALKYFEKHLEISEKLGDMSGIARAYGNIGRVYYVKGDWDEALKYHEKHLEISEKLGDIHRVAIAYCNIGEVQSKKGEWDKAMDYYKKSLKILEELGDIYNIAHIYRDTGDIFFAKKEYKQALNWYLKASEMFEKLGAKHELTITKEKVSNTYENLE